ncbi:unnamed protein product [Mytilus coruscus]|uniref:EB domain-containing protein n=1 Tax=Mytilus coruscus TaxID=42192 RepID=A0A6J8CPS0_MYTCO|nr:unnamed protein product [Mytilus coruscus]
MDLLARFVGIWMVFVIYIAVDVEGAIYGETCSVNSDCTESNAVNCDTTSGNCICEDTFFRKTTPAACASRVALNGVCELAQTSTEQCAIDNSECIDVSGTVRCICSTTHYETGGACELRIALDTDCTSSDQCVADTDCRDNGAGTDQCQCTIATHYKSGSSCIARIKPNIDCTAVGQCVTNAECDTADTGTCLCNAGYTATPTTTPTMCSGVVKFASLSYMYVVPILVSMMFFLR